MGIYATNYEQLVDCSANYLQKYDAINMEVCLVLYIYPDELFLHKLRIGFFFFLLNSLEVTATYFC